MATVIATGAAEDLIGYEWRRSIEDAAARWSRGRAAREFADEVNPWIDRAGYLYGAYRFLKSRFSKKSAGKMPLNRKSMLQAGFVPASYRVRGRGRMRDGGCSRYDKYGTTGEHGVYGSTLAPAVAYLGVSSNNLATTLPGSIVFQISAALLRYIFLKEYRWNVVHGQETLENALGLTNTDYNTPRALRLIAIDYTSGIQVAPNTDYVPGGNLVEASVQKSAVEISFNGTTTFNEAAGLLAAKLTSTGSERLIGLNRRIYGYQVVSTDLTSTTTNTRNYGQIRRIDNMVMKCYSVACVAVQNITKADVVTGEQLDTSRSDRNPVEGKLFEFSSAHPRFSETLYNNHNGGGTTTYSTLVGQTWRWVDNNVDGVLVPTANTNAAQSLSTVTDMQQVPDATLFDRNVLSGIRKVSIDPGKVIRFDVKFSYTGDLNKLLFGLLYRDNMPGAIFGITRYQRTGPFKNLGTSAFLAVEKVVSDGAGPEIHFEVEHKAGAVVLSNRLMPFVRQVAANSLVNPGDTDQVAPYNTEPPGQT